MKKSSTTELKWVIVICFYLSKLLRRLPGHKLQDCLIEPRAEVVTGLSRKVKAIMYDGQYY
jgi:hypothetical protein